MIPNAGPETGTVFALGPGGCLLPLHFEGKYEYKDPWQLSYRAESEIARLILEDPFTYRLYVETLERVIEKVTPAMFQSATNRTRSELLPLLDSAEVNKALRRAGNRISAESANDRLNEMAALFLARRDRLVENIGRYRRAKN